MASLRITQTRSVIGHPRDQRETIKSLGIRRMWQQVERPDNPAVRGMVDKVKHLLKVEEID